MRFKLLQQTSSRSCSAGSRSLVILVVCVHQSFFPSQLLRKEVGQAFQSFQDRYIAVRERGVLRDALLSVRGFYGDDTAILEQALDLFLSARHALAHCCVVFSVEVAFLLILLCQHGLTSCPQKSLKRPLAAVLESWQKALQEATEAFAHMLQAYIPSAQLGLRSKARTKRPKFLIHLLSRAHNAWQIRIIGLHENLFLASLKSKCGLCGAAPKQTYQCDGKEYCPSMISVL